MSLCINIIERLLIVSLTFLMQQNQLRNKQGVHRGASFVADENIGFSDYSVIQNTQVFFFLCSVIFNDEMVIY